MIENGGTPAIATLFGYCLGGGLRVAAGLSFPDSCQEGAQIGLPEMDLAACLHGVVRLDFLGL